ncbi:MAG: hypothetical protein MUF04_14715, partial [Akkermansiaceae bacterium]|nr:hypothetical protein [Akkermansiaceae bacterium]
ISRVQNLVVQKPSGTPRLDLFFQAAGFQPTDDLTRENFNPIGGLPCPAPVPLPVFFQPPGPAHGESNIKAIQLGGIENIHTTVHDLERAMGIEPT